MSFKTTNAKIRTSPHRFDAGGPNGSR